jgi:acyl-CoA reductase-like NAD-dependent aldehyde dehydrogenase
MTAKGTVAVRNELSSWLMLIGGRLRGSADGATYPSYSPSTGELLAEVPSAGPEDVDRAVAAGQLAFEQWRTVVPRQRAAVLRRIATVLRDNQAELALLDALDCGHPITAMRGDVELAAELLENYADWSAELGGSAPPGDSDHLHYTVREPYGVVARIVPYNHPLMFAASKLAAPLLAGNAVILKAPDQTPLSTLRLGELLADVVPPGLVSFLTGSGAIVGPALIGHRAIRRIAFTGSVRTGQSVLAAAAQAGIKSVSLELGGKNPMIILADADVAAASAGAVTGMNFHWTGGQSCGSTSRLLVHRSLMDEVVERVVAGTDSVRVGDPLDEKTEMGCMVTPQHRDRVLDYIARGRDEGLQIATGGGAPADPALDGGAFVAPTVFVDVPPTSVLSQEEIFGPVLVITPFNDEHEAVDMVNLSELGLTASIWTRDVSKAHRLARAVEAGYVWVNTASRHFVGLPFGGVKDSGLSREESVEELHSFTQTKAVTVRLDERN